MKKIFKYAFLGAIALSGTVGFSACSSSDDVVDNPDNNPETNTVKAQFAINLPSNVTGKTRQSGDIVQQAQNIASFRGMDNIVLYPFGATATTSGTSPIVASSTKLGDAITLKGLVKPDQTTSPSENTIPAGGTGLLNESNAVLYNDVSIPVGTGSFLFYGKAIDSGTDKFVNGSLTMTGDEPSNITFTPTQIYPAGTSVSAVGAQLVTYMNHIVQAEHWADCADPTKSGESYYNVALGDLYTNFTSLKAGSSLDVQSVIQDLYMTIKDNTDVVSTAIKTAILHSTYVTDTNNPATLTFSSVLGNSFTEGTGKTLYFPFDVNLPDGSALLNFNSSTKTFSQVTNGTGNTGNDITASYDKYVYPASLYYYSNSGIKTATTSQIANYNGTNNWTTILGGYSGSSVLASTRSVAILDPIEYGVGRLDMTIQTESNTLYDRNGDAYDATAGFTVTGVLIGGQKAVGYNFEPISSATSLTLYDNIQRSQPSVAMNATTTASPVNHTLALETETNTTIYIAVELINKGENFHGADGMVPKGCKFYLIAALDPSADNTHVNGSATTNHQVFKQDYITTANLKILAGSSGAANDAGLGKAYNTIPDLRAPELELGLSVDLSWKPGITFTVEI